MHRNRGRLALRVERCQILDSVFHAVRDGFPAHLEQIFCGRKCCLCRALQLIGKLAEKLLCCGGVAACLGGLFGKIAHRTACAVCIAGDGSGGYSGLAQCVQLVDEVLHCLGLSIESRRSLCSRSAVAPLDRLQLLGQFLEAVLQGCGGRFGIIEFLLKTADLRRGFQPGLQALCEGFYLLVQLCGSIPRGVELSVKGSLRGGALICLNLRSGILYGLCLSQPFSRIGAGGVCPAAAFEIGLLPFKLRKFSLGVFNLDSKPLPFPRGFIGAQLFHDISAVIQFEQRLFGLQNGFCQPVIFGGADLRLAQSDELCFQISHGAAGLFDVGIELAYLCIGTESPADAVAQSAYLAFQRGDDLAGAREGFIKISRCEHIGQIGLERLRRLCSLLGGRLHLSGRAPR